MQSERVCRSKSERLYKLLKKAEIDATSNISFGLSKSKTLLKEKQLRRPKLKIQTKKNDSENTQ